MGYVIPYSANFLSTGSMGCTLWDLWSHRVHTFHLWDALYGIIYPIDLVGRKCVLYGIIYPIECIYGIIYPIECTICIYWIYGMHSMGSMIPQTVHFLSMKSMGCTLWVYDPKERTLSVYWIYGMHSMGSMIPYSAHFLSMRSMGCTLWDIWSHRVHTFYLWDLWNALYGIFDPKEWTLFIYGIYGMYDPIECTLSMYLDYFPLLPDDDWVTAETCCLEVNHRVFICLSILYVVSLEGIISTTTYYNRKGWLALKKI